MDTDYALYGILLIILILLIFIMGYMYWFYTQTENNYSDMEDMITDMYALQVAESKRAGVNAILDLPKRTKTRMDKKNSKKC